MQNNIFIDKNFCEAIFDRIYKGACPLYVQRFNTVKRKGTDHKIFLLTFLFSRQNGLKVEAKTNYETKDRTGVRLRTKNFRAVRKAAVFC
jgi:hypothetical protein